MTVSLGRCTGLIQTSKSESGDTVTIQGITPDDATRDTLNAYRQQLLGLVGNEDEDIVPCIWSDDPTMNGFYRPSGISVSDDGALDDGALTFSATLQRLQSYAAPLWEVTVQSALRANTSGIVGPAHCVVASPASGDGTTIQIPPAMGVTATDTVAVYPYAASLPLVRSFRSTFPAVAQYRCSQAPQWFYNGACTVERSTVLVEFGNGPPPSTYVPVVGRSIPSTYQSWWRITNGLVRLTVGFNHTDLEVWNSTTQLWDMVYFIGNGGTGSDVLGYVGSAPTYSWWNSVQILRNSPECVVVRHSGIEVQETFSLRRGERHVVYTQKRLDGGNIPVGEGIRFLLNAASTAIAGGIKQTTADAKGHRGVIASPHVCTANLAIGSLGLTAAMPGPMTFMLGVELRAAFPMETAEAVVGQFMGAVSTTQRVVSP